MVFLPYSIIIIIRFLTNKILLKRSLYLLLNYQLLCSLFTLLNSELWLLLTTEIGIADLWFHFVKSELFEHPLYFVKYLI